MLTCWRIFYSNRKSASAVRWQLHHFVDKKSQPFSRLLSNCYRDYFHGIYLLIFISVFAKGEVWQFLQVHFHIDGLRAIIHKLRATTLNSHGVRTMYPLWLYFMCLIVLVCHFTGALRRWRLRSRRGNHLCCHLVALMTPWPQRKAERGTVSLRVERRATREMEW